jgi:putative transposase
MILKAFKYELNPNAEQVPLLNKTLGCARFIYNWGLNEKRKAYAQNQLNLSCLDLIKELPKLKKTEGMEWLKEVPSQTLQMALRNLDNAFTNFFKKKAQYPKFKKKSRHQSFQYPQGVAVLGDRVFLPKIGWCSFWKHRDLLGEIKTVTVSKTPTGNYFISILCDTKFAIPKKAPIQKETTVGVDLGIKTFAVLSNGKGFENQKQLTTKLRILRVEQRKLQRCQKGSQNRVRQRLVVAKLHEKIQNQRKDFLHKVSFYLTENFDTICMEDLNISGMMKNSNLSRSIGEQGWGMLNTQIQYKCEWKGKNYIQIGRFAPSSKRCNGCGHIHKDLKLADRVWMCANCNQQNDRDANAALNIRDYGLRFPPKDVKVEH